MNNNNIALSKFKNAIVHLEQFGDDGFMLNGKVSYQSSMYRTITENMDVWLIIGGYEPCVKLDIYSTCNKIKSDLYHMDFLTSFGNPEFIYNDSEKALYISGSSNKVGNYKVTITEVL